jgi:hypothetical protein
MKDLIERLGKAEGPDRELDGDIFAAAGGAAWEEAYRLAQEPCGCPHDVAVRDAKSRYSPRYTASLDAALSLVPEGWIWDVASTGCAWTMPEGALGWHVSISGPRSPALALCIVALKARDFTERDLTKMEAGK